MKKFYDKSKVVKWIDFLGEYIVYLFVFVIFIDSKLNLKTRYILEGIAILKLIYDRKNIKIGEKNIYITYIIILILGIVFNFFSSNSNGIDKFISRNIKFISGLIIVFFIDSRKKINILNNIILIGTFILTIGMWRQFSYIKLDFIHQRGILLLGTTYSLIYFLEQLKRVKKDKNSIKILLLGLLSFINIYGISLSDSRMGFLVLIGIIGLYVIYNLFFNISFKKIIVSILLGVSSCVIFYQISPGWFKSELKTSFELKNNFSNEARLIMWEGSWNAFKSSPLIGVGSSVYDTEPYIIEVGSKTTRSEELRTAFKNKNFGEAHSIYFNFLAQVGSLTLIYLYLFFILIPKKFIFGKKDKISIASFFGIISFYIYGLTWSIWGYYGLIQVLFQVYLSMLIISNNLGEEKDENVE